MPRTGRPPKPVEEKRRIGNPGKRKLPGPGVVALAPIAVLPATPSPDSGDELVAAILSTAASAWIAEPDRLVLLDLLRDGWTRRMALLADIAEHGRSYQSVSRVAGVQWHDRPEVRQLADLEKQITSWLSLLGLSPTDRSRLGVAEVKARSKLEELRARREARGLRAG